MLFENRLDLTWDTGGLGVTKLTHPQKHILADADTHSRQEGRETRCPGEGDREIAETPAHNGTRKYVPTIGSTSYVDHALQKPGQETQREAS